MTSKTGAAALSGSDFGQDVARMHELSLTELYSLPDETVAEIQIIALRKHFASLVDRLTTLGRLAEAQNIQDIQTLDDAAPLLFPHSHYKSYSVSILETGRFERLTRWLGGLTTRDLSHVQADVETIDDWLDEMDAQTDLRLVHSSGTTGKLSFLPRSSVEMKRAVRGLRHGYEGFGDEPNNALTDLKQYPFICPTQRRGAMGHARLMDALVEHLYDGDENMVVALSPDRISADMLSLSGRIRVAEAKGDVGRLQISPKLLERRDAFMRDQAKLPAQREAFFEDLARRYRGRRVIINGNWGMHYDLAAQALVKGVRGIFAPDSLMYPSGGMKGRVLPDNYRQVVQEVLGLPEIRSGYGMSELFQLIAACPLNHHHLRPYWVPFVLDPQTGAPSPRTGVHTGRFGFVDLMAETYWGGFLSGDEVTINWGDKQPCGCGRKGPFLHSEVRRFSEKEGGDDKITCAGAPEAHDKALNFLAELG